MGDQWGDVFTRMRVREMDKGVTKATARVNELERAVQDTCERVKQLEGVLSMLSEAHFVEEAGVL